MLRVLFIFAMILGSTSAFAGGREFLLRFQSAETVEKYIIDNRDTLSVRDCEILALGKKNERAGLYLMASCHTQLKEKSNSDRCASALERLISTVKWVPYEDFAYNSRLCVEAYPVNDIVEQCLRVIEVGRNSYKYTCNAKGETHLCPYDGTYYDCDKIRPGAGKRLADLI